MIDERRASRWMAVLLLLQMTGGFVTNFVLLKPLTGPGGYLETAGAHSFELSLAAVTGLATGALAIALALVAWPVFRRESEVAGLCYLAAAIASFCLCGVEMETVLSMSSLSQAYAGTQATDAASLRLLAGAVGATRRWAHYIHVLSSASCGLVLFGVLFRFALVPRALAGFGIAAGVLLVAALGMPIFGRPIVFPLLAPMGLAQLALALWLLAAGLRSAAA